MLVFLSLVEGDGEAGGMGSLKNGDNATLVLNHLRLYFSHRVKRCFLDLEIWSSSREHSGGNEHKNCPSE